MKLRTATKNTLNRVLDPLGVKVMSRWELESLRNDPASLLPAQGPPLSATLPEGAEDYLQPDNPRLTELRSRYRGLDCPAVNHSFWTDALTSQIDLRNFRADSPYVWQYLDKNVEINYVLTALYLKSIDKLGLLGCLKEDGLFGAVSFQCDEHLVLSRDLLDSVSEIAFLEETLDISNMTKLNILDIGAGYGRFAHRLCLSLPTAQVICTDAVPESTFLSEYYLQFRGVTNNAQVVPLDEIERVLDETEIALAVNIHSFTECGISSVGWWLDLFAKHRVRYFFIVPNAEQNGGNKMLTQEPPGNQRQDIISAILSRGYKLIRKRAKYNISGVQKYGVSPTHYYLFELKD